MQSQKDRATTSCSECQRRKQKCSREWPCNHCQARKVPHLCQFGPKKIQQPSPPDSGSREKSSSVSEARGTKRGMDETLEHTEPLIEAIDGDEDGLKMWGYMPGHVHYSLAQGNDGECFRKRSPSGEDAEVQKALHAIPPRSITDAFVEHFLKVVNFRYSSIYGPIFTENYVEWWTDRAEAKPLSAEFTTLLLRVLSYSVQYLTPELRKMIEFELACKLQSLTERFSSAAEQLSKSFPPYRSSIERVQEQFLKGAWLKSEGRIVEAWHALGRTIREAQELGIDKETGIEGLSEFDIEIRRRLWALLFIWDWQMSAWLGRPHLIDQKDLSFVFPTLRLDQSPAEPNLLSPFAHISLQAHLARRVALLMEGAQAIRDCSPKQIDKVLAEVHKFIDELPPIFRFSDTDHSLDEKYPYFVFQRLQMHVVIYMTMLDFLKPYLAQDPQKPRTPRDDEFRKIGVDLGLKLLVVSRQLFDHEFPINAKFHLVVFCIFDTATILCSAIIHDVESKLPRREEVMDAVEMALEMLHQLSLSTRIGASSYRFLYKLVHASPVLSRHSPIAKRRREFTKEHVPAQQPLPTTPPSEPLPLSLPPVTAAPTSASFDFQTQLPSNGVPNGTQMPTAVPLMATTEDLRFNPDHFLAQNPFGGEQLDIGGMEVVWDYGDLNLDFLGPATEWQQ